MRRRIRLAALVGMLPAVALAAPPLPGVGADGRGVTVSGISSGGYMAVQFQVVYSKRVRGAGIIAAGPYDCAQGSSIRALKHCMSPTWWASPPGPAEVKLRMEPRARLGLIDPPASLADDRVWMLGGAADTTVEPPVMDALEAFYRQWVPAGAIRRVRLPEAGHAMISVADGKANACLLAFLARGLGVSRSAVTLKSGDCSRHKVVDIRGITPEAAAGLLPVKE